LRSFTAETASRGAVHLAGGFFVTLIELVTIDMPKPSAGIEMRKRRKSAWTASAQKRAMTASSSDSHERERWQFCR
jgi:hypothetical protein